MTSLQPLAFVGRERELARLLELLTEARNGRGRYVTVIGPAGIGKSRLLQRLNAGGEHLGASFSGRCAPGDAPLAPWTQILAQAHGGRPGTSLAGTVAVDPLQLADTLVERWAAAAPPVLVIIDDLHHADAASRTVLRSLLPAIAEEPVLLVATIRAPRADAHAETEPLPLPDEELLLTGFGSSDILALLRDREVAPPAAGLDALASRLLAVTGGSPLALNTSLALAEMAGQVLGSPLDGAAVADSAPAFDGLDDAVTARPVDRPLLQALARLEPEAIAVLRLLALAPSLTRRDLVSLAGASTTALAETLRRGAELGLVSSDRAQAGAPVLHPRVAELLAASLAEDERAALHARLAEYLAADGAVPATVVAYHALEAAGALPVTRLAELTERAGNEALAQGALVAADRFLAASQEASGGDDHRRLRCLLGRAAAAQRSGDLSATASFAQTAARLAGALGESDALAEAAVRYAYPPEWRAGDPVAATLLATASQAEPSAAWLAQVLAVQAVTEMRLPVADDGSSQWSWVTRRDVGQPLAERAVSYATRSGDDTATVMALLAWRSTHRAPEFLGRRRQLSARAQRIAQRLHRFDLLVDAALRGATDELEAGSRAGFEEAVALVRWAAERANEPRLLWRAACLEAARGFFDGDLDVLAEHRQRARQIAEQTPLPGAVVAEQLFAVQSALLAGEHGVLVQAVVGDHPGTRHQLGRAGAAYLAAVLDRPDDAERLLAQLVQPLDPESSLLLTATLAARAVAILGEPAHARWLLEVLSPWRSHVAVDSECLWPAIPVAIATAQLHRLLADDAAASADDELAAGTAAQLGSPVIAKLLDRPTVAEEPLLTDRQRAVLAGLAAGRSNAQLALDLRFSVATIRRETSVIYRTLRVGGRAEAVNEAHRRGLIEPWLPS